MGAGEASIVAAGIEKKELVVTTDNRQGRKATIVNGLSLVGSIEIIVSLYKRKKITYEKAGSAFKTLKEDGWFDSYLIEKALEDLK
jgi:predicted nucleic acid-binding protein